MQGLEVEANGNHDGDMAVSISPKGADDSSSPGVVKDPGKDTMCAYFDPEDDAFYEEHGRRIARRNLWVSIPNLLLSFAVWIIWSVIAAKIQKAHDKDPNVYDFPDLGDLTGDEYKGLLFSLPAISGLSGATLRIPNSFMIALSGGRNVIALSTLLLILPMVGAGQALMRSDVAFSELVVYATLCGVGGGAFSSSMSNISFFFPKREQGLALGLNAGLGNIGVAIVQLMAPVVMDVDMGLGGSLAGTFWVQNAAWLWLPFSVVAMIMAWFMLNNLPKVTINDKFKNLVFFWHLEGLGFVASGLSVMVLVLTTNKAAFSHPAASFFRVFVLALLAVSVMMFFMKTVTPGAINEPVKKQFAIFKNHHTWTMTYLYIATFGSFIGFSSAFPKLILDIFGYERDGKTPRDGAPDTFAYAWLGAFVGSVTRPLGGWLSDKYGGARVTQISIAVLVASCLCVGIVVSEAAKEENYDKSNEFFGGFLFLFLVLFAATGIGNGSTFRMVPIIFAENPEQAGPVLGWTAAVAAYGAFVIPALFGIAIKEGAPEVAFYGFSAYYLSCVALNWWYYVRDGCEIKC